MKNRSVRALMLVAMALLFGCSSDPAGDDSSGGSGVSGGAGAAALGGSGGSTSVPSGKAGTTPTTPPTGGAGGSTASTAGTGGTGGAAGVAAGGAGGVAGAAGAGGAGGAGGAAGAAGAGGAAGMDAMGAEGNDLTGMLGALGPVEPVLNAWATSNGLETLIYLTTAPLTCEMMKTMGTPWLRSLPAGSQVIEIVVRGKAMVGTTMVGFLQGEVNYAEGSKSSSYEVVGSSGSIMFTTADDMMLYEGTITAMFPGGGMVSGSFRAEWCEGGAEY